MGRGALADGYAGAGGEANEEDDASIAAFAKDTACWA